MNGPIDQAHHHRPLSETRWAIGTVGFSFIAFAVECLAIVMASLVSGVSYHLAAYNNVGGIDSYLALGGLTALLYTLPFATRDEYSVEDFLEGRRATSRIFVVWNYAFLSLAVIGFLTKTTAVFSRGWLVLFYILGLLVVIAVDALIDAVVKSALKRGHIESRRLMLIGSEAEIARARAGIDSLPSNVRVVATAVLPDPERASNGQDLKQVLAEIVMRARAARVEDVVVLVDWAQSARIEAIAKGLLVLPSAIHVGAGSVIGRFANPRIARFGGTTALSLTGAPIGPIKALTKRTFDLLIATAALALLSPVFAAIALIIKLDSPGPVFFRQRRRGYNLEEFRIWKFRTMTTLEDGDQVTQAQRGDMRITRAGRWLRRYNIDELPQLINVLMGQMSLVGPRPHAVAHDLHFETRIIDYPRRLNVKPGITGWAQVHGLRGATETEDDMRRRVEYDIHYIENWSIVLDLYILALTLLSPRAYRNAY
ncbi:MAG: undecaprenyl-phosphate glucose phosphotransferase [Hyphomicrobiaceae bacterium]|nr:undecaprenyl-phosphate glucose phosphotransferase [Hyphomicrobiaceae bacterium]